MPGKSHFSHTFINKYNNLKDLTLFVSDNPHTLDLSPKVPNGNLYVDKTSTYYKS